MNIDREKKVRNNNTGERRERERERERNKREESTLESVVQSSSYHFFFFLKRGADRDVTQKSSLQSLKKNLLAL